MMDKDKDVVPPLDKSKEVVPSLVEVPVQEHPNAKWRNYMHYHEEAGLTHFRKFSVKTNTCCSWRVTVKMVDGRVALDQGLATFAFVHQVRIGHMLSFKLLTPNNMKVIIFNDNGVDVVTKCKKHNEAFTVAA
ncbi:hypothetical protein ZWY2020_045513 [Hordeum vulgare]|nr:hypothetical protein ZWY2020_045513 [Hordeum vulgare]